MIRRAAQIGVEKPASAGSWTAIRRLEGDKYSVNTFEHASVVDLKNPATDGGVVHQEQAQILGPVLVALAISPRLESSGSACILLCLQIKSIKEEEFFLRIIDASECPFGFAAAIHVIDVYNVKIARAEKIPGIGILNSRHCGNVRLLFSVVYLLLELIQGEGLTFFFRDRLL